jgi:tyrosine-specific transport protein
MRKKIREKFAFGEAVATLVGTIIGAGILGVPFVIAQVGVGPGLSMLFVLGIAALLLNLMFSEVVLRTRYRHQIAGYAKKYLGKFAYRVTVFSALVGGYGALTAYLIGEGEVLAAVFGGDGFVYSLAFFAVAAFILLVGLDLVKVFEFWMVAVFIVIIFVIFSISLTNLQVENFFYSDFSRLLIPYGVILFAYGGAASIVPVREILRKEPKAMKKAVITGSVVPIFLYTLFAVVVVGVTGKMTSEVATIGLGDKIGQSMVVFGNLFAFFAMGTSFLSIGVTLKELFRFDFKYSAFMSWLLVISVPLVIFLASARDFIQTMSIAGSLTFGLTGIILVLMFWKAKKSGDQKPEFKLPKFKIIGWLLITMFALGIVYTIYDLIV